MTAKSRPWQVTGCRRREAIAGLAALALASPLPTRAQLKPNPTGLEVETIEVEARPIAAFDRANASLTRFGRLEFIGGLVLSSASANFGGWSGLALDADGRRLFAVSDAGSWMTAELVSERGVPTSIANARLGPIGALKGASLKRERDRDAESVALAEGTLANGVVLIAFERNRRIGRFPISERGLGVPTSYLKLPADASRMSSNKAFEAVTVLTGGPSRGAAVAFAERYLDDAGNHTGWIWIGGEPQRLAVRNVGDYDLTDAAALPDGGLLLLERRFRWLEGVKMRIRRLAAGEVRPGALAEGEILIEATMAQQIDNMEGMAVHRTRAGETIITLVSDDNFNHYLQRNLLLRFRLADDVSARSATPRP